MAEQIYPIITPLTTSIDMLWTLRDIKSTNPIEIIAPTNAAAINTQEVIFTACPIRNTMTSATTIFAPEEIPNTNGPAIGL